LDFTPMEAILAATMHGAAAMDMPGEIGQIREGFLADLLLVDGNPVADVSILQDRNNLLAIMKDGAFHKRPAVAREAQVAAE
ncbi:MAG: amidohydrolase family protein, partial [Alphaproteobacteria bacterium]